MPKLLRAAASQHAPRCLGSDAWQALQGRNRDITYLSTVLLAICLLAARIVPSYCAYYPACFEGTWSHRAVCGCLLPSTTGTTALEQTLLGSAGSQAASVINFLVQLLSGPWLIGWLVQCMALPSVALLAASHLLVILAPLPCLQRTQVGPGHGPGSSSSQNSPDTAGLPAAGASAAAPSQQTASKQWGWLPWRLTWRHPDWYWRVPCARNTAALLLRVSICSVGALGIGPLRGVEELLKYHPLAQWPHMHYLWPCWQACCMLLPLRLQVLICSYEWAMAFYTVCRFKGWSLHQQSLSTFMSHLVLGGALVVAVPVAASWLAQRSYGSRYALYRRQAVQGPPAGQQQAGGVGKKGDPAWEDDWERARCTSDGQETCATSSRSSSSNVGALSGPPPSSSNLLGLRRRPLSSAMQALPSTVSATRPLPATDAVMGGVTTPAASADVGRPWQEVHDQLAAVFGPQWANDMLQAAQAGVSNPALGYKAATRVTPVGIKVHTRHSRVDQLGPVLRRCAEASIAQEQAGRATQAAAGSGTAAAAGVHAAAAAAAAAGLNAPQARTPHGQLQAACFAGCVQLLGCVYSMGSDQAGVSKLRTLRLLSDILIAHGVAGTSAGAGAGGHAAGAAAANAAASGVAADAYKQVLALQQQLEGASSDWEEEDEEGVAAAVDVLVGDLFTTLGGAGGEGFPADGLLAQALAAGLQLLYIEPPAITAAGGEEAAGGTPTAPPPAAAGHGVQGAAGAAVGEQQPQELVVFLDWPEEEAAAEDPPGTCGNGNGSNNSSQGGGPPVHLVAGQTIATSEAGVNKPQAAGMPGEPAVAAVHGDSEDTAAGTMEGQEEVCLRQDVSKPLGRLLLFMEQQVVVDVVVVLQQRLRVALPPLQQGVYYVALLPHEGPSTSSQQGAPGGHAVASETGIPLSASGNTSGSSSSSGMAMCSAPLVMSPLIVLPAAAAKELQQLWVSGCEAMQQPMAEGEVALGLPADWPADKQAAWACHRAKVMVWDSCMADIVQDIGAVLAYSSNPSCFLAATRHTSVSTSSSNMGNVAPGSSSAGAAAVDGPGAMSGWSPQAVSDGQQPHGVPAPLAAPLLELQEMTGLLMAFLWQHDMLATANMLVSCLTALATGAPASPAPAAACEAAAGDAAAAAAAPAAASHVPAHTDTCRSNGDIMQQGLHNGVASDVTCGTHVTSCGDAGASTGFCAAPASTVQEPAADCATCSTSSSSSSRAAGDVTSCKQQQPWSPGVEVAAAGPQLAAAARQELAWITSAKALLGLLWGFRAPGLEAAYVRHVNGLPMWGDVVSLCIPLLPLVLGDSLGILLELRQSHSAQQLLGCLGGLLGLVALGMASSLGRILVGPWLRSGLWREWAHLAVEAGMATAVVANLLGWPCLIPGKQPFLALSLWGNFHLLVAFVSRAVLRKVRLRLQLPWLALEQAIMTRMALNSGAAPAGLLLLRYACCLAACAVTVGAVEVWRRQGFLRALQQQKVTGA